MARGPYQRRSLATAQLPKVTEALPDLHTGEVDGIKWIERFATGLTMGDTMWRAVYGELPGESQLVTPRLARPKGKD